ncbi:hypothetical protein D1818_21645 [Aquimarina sp. BL5]|uniref:lipocalin family protein n=1 Tax=Aquimarina sp. BL5 TaxID=1714860 RepID=UPI000E4AEBD9|nr:lipocalin family protein [Aquimarina sp. BL5]AXT53300.1 hypothetical protein D1818_21645 [Aquimarina sp. BL5]RKM89845.1 hypothetical protein D7036_24215 [Aquimarina sp. BL5]
MKKLLLIPILFFTIISQISCNNDDDSSTQNENFETLILGKWILTGITDNGVEETLNVCDLMDSYEFNADNTAIYIEHGGNTAETCEPFEDSETWSINGSILTSQFDNSTENATILELTSTVLRLEYTEGNSGNDPDVLIFSYEK